MARNAISGDLLERIGAELQERLQELRPAVEEHAALLAAAESLGEPSDVAEPARADPPRLGRRPRKRPGRAPARSVPGAPRGASQKAILAALEHGSHTLSELSVVTALSAGEIRRAVSALVGAGHLARAARSGKPAYVLASAAAAAPSAPRKGARAK
jgi:hypothetical protein